MARLPAALRLRRKYEVDESHPLVVWARPKYAKLRLLIIKFREADASHGLIVKFRQVDVSHRLGVWASSQYQELRLIVRFRGFPKSYESSFVLKMDEFERKGIPFVEVLRDTTPKLFGEGPAEVLRRWIGSKARKNPVRFAKTMSKMFGSSAKPVLDSLQALADDEAMLKAKVEEVPPAQYLLEKMASLGIQF